MSHDFSSADLGSDIPSPGDFIFQIDVPYTLDMLPDGRVALVIGNPVGDANFHHRQGENDDDFRGTCGLVSDQQILCMFGIEVSENDIVRYAIEHGLCNTEGEASDKGGTTLFQQAIILREFNVPAHVEALGYVKGLAENFERGKGIVIEVNAGVLWNDIRHYDDGDANHAVVLTGIARDPGNGELLGFYINDSSKKAGTFIDVSVMKEAWENVGGMCVVTDIVRSTVPIRS